MPIVIGGKAVSVAIAPMASQRADCVSGQNVHYLDAAKPIESLLHDRLVLECLRVRCLGSHRRSTRCEARMAIPPLRRSSCDIPQGGRSDLRQVPLPYHGGHHAGPGQECLAGRDRCRRRAGRLPQVQRTICRGAVRAAAGAPLARCVEPHRVPPLRGLRVCGFALQLYGNCRQSPRGAGADGERGSVETL